MFDGKYLEWNQRRIKCIIDFYGHKFMFSKTVLDLGCGQADISGALYRLGADITVVDARQEHLQTANKKFPGIKTVKADLDRSWPFQGKKFDVILDLALLCHLRDYEQHLIDVCTSTTYLVLETAVCDSSDPNKSIQLAENKGIYDTSINGVASRPTAAAIERVLSNCGMTFRRLDTNKLNAVPFIYDWQPKNNEDTSINNRRMWFAVKSGNSVVQTHSSAPTLTLIKDQSLAIPHATAALQNTHQPTHVHISVPPHAEAPPPLSTNYAIAVNPGDKKFVVVIPSYNNRRWCDQNIMSALNQNYDKYRIIFTDDCSYDDTFARITELVNSSGKANKCTLIRNTSRLGALQNLYNMIHSCADDEIILTLDGDDWFPHDNVLNKLNEIYSGGDIWMTYGQYKNSNDGNIGIAQPYPPHIINTGAFRQHVWCASHLRTFYAWLFKKIRQPDLLYGNEFFAMTWDFAMMFPMLEMAGEHSKYVSDILYVYNLDNPINDHKVNVRLQQDLDRHIRGMAKYSPCSPPQPKKTNVGLLLIATGKYHRFIQGIISSADNYFIKDDKYNITYYVFTDGQPHIQSSRKIVFIPIEHKNFPFASMDRFKHFTANTDKLSQEDYLYYVDVDCLFVDNVSTEILGNLVGVQHCGYVNKAGPYETNVNSMAYIEPGKYWCYFGGGFSGGTVKNYLELSKWCSDMLDIDVSKGIIPIWHDESMINKYFSNHKPDVILNPSYHYPQGNIQYYKNIWAPNDYKPKILLLDKNHSEIRN